VTSGIRLGTPAMTTRGLGPADMRAIGAFVLEVFKSGQDDKKIRSIGEKVQAFASGFPAFQN
jgi:glycine hydroxymethyltransferase